MKVLKRELQRFETQQKTGVYKTILEEHEVFNEGEKIRISLYDKNKKFVRSIVREVSKIVLCFGESKVLPNYRIATFEINQPKQKHDE